MSEESFIRTLEENHKFPELVQIKVIGANRPEFVTEVLLVIRETLNVHFEPRHSIKETSNQKHASITIEVIAGSAELLAGAYRRLSQIQGVVMVL